MDDRQDLPSSTRERAFALHEAGEIEAAATGYQAVLAANADDVAVLCHLGSLELDRDRPAASVPLLERAAALRPDLPEVQNYLGMGFQALERWGEATQAFERALKLDPQFAAAFFHLGEIAESLGRAETAVALYRQTLEHDPEAAIVHVTLGRLLFRHGNWTGAVQCYRAALQLPPVGEESERLETQCELGVALLRQNALDKSAQVFREILAVRPNLAEIHSNLSYIYERQGRANDAVAAAHRAVEIKPEMWDGHNNLGVALRAAHHLKSARQAFERASELNPDFSLARFNFGSVCLMQEDYAAGWPAYESRTALMAHPLRQFQVPRWNGEPLPGKTLLLHAEQGYGDTFQFLRFVNDAKRRSGARIVLELPPATMSLLADATAADECVTYGKVPSTDIDAEAPLPSLPGILGVGATELPGTIPYIAADPERREEWRARLNRGGTATHIGLVWQGNSHQAQDHVRSCPLSAFAALQSLANVRWFSLQKDLPAKFPDTSGLGITPLGHLLHDFADTAAVMSALDLVITVDTSTAHLAGALGVPTWTLLCHTPDWRWLLRREDSPWYPGMRLFRQPRWGDWTSVLQAVAVALNERLSRRAA